METPCYVFKKTEAKVASGVRVGAERRSEFPIYGIANRRYVFFLIFTTTVHQARGMLESKKLALTPHTLGAHFSARDCTHLR